MIHVLRTTGLEQCSGLINVCRFQAIMGDNVLLPLDYVASWTDKAYEVLIFFLHAFIPRD